MSISLSKLPIMENMTLVVSFKQILTFCIMEYTRKFTKNVRHKKFNNKSHKISITLKFLHSIVKNVAEVL